ncbi:hypothetical protein SVIOM74S_05191 [Streptomyces violarus]
MEPVRYCDAAARPRLSRSSLSSSWPRATLSWMVEISFWSFSCFSLAPLYFSVACSASS